MIRILTILSISSLLFSCGPSKFVEPIAYKQLSIGGHFGGPALDYGIPIPLPISAIEIGYGLDTNVTVFGTLHTTSIIFGNFQTDLGATFKVLNQKTYRPNISISPGFNFIYSFSSDLAKLWPTLDLNAYWNYGNRKNYFYFGVNNYFELSKAMANGQDQVNHWLYNPQIGHVLKGKNGNGQFTAEIKWLGPNHENDFAFIPYATPQGNNGAIGVYFGYRWLLKNKG